MSYKFTLGILILFSIASLTAAQSSSIWATNYTVSYANQTINQTLSYINQVNQSAYLIFYPNLAKAYSYLTKAQQVYTTSPGSAVTYSNQAYLIGQQQYAQINAYRSLSVVVMLILTGVFLLWLYGIMKPIQNERPKRKR